MMQRQHDTLQTNLAMNFAMSVSRSTQSLTSPSNFSRVYSWLAAFAFAKSCTSSALNASAFLPAAISFVCEAISCSRQVGSDPGVVGHLQQGSGSGHAFGVGTVGGVDVGSGSHEPPGGFG